MTRPTKEERLKYNVDYPQDTAFSAYARLLQSKWRAKKGYPESKLGNFIEPEFAKSTKVNFLTDNIKKLVSQELENARKSGGLISEPRIWNNLLSSQPLCFNLFGELYFDLDLASSYFKLLFPNRIDRVTAVKFEYSPGRGDLKYIGDHSAFDVFVEYSKDNKSGFIGIEVKYAESLKEETKEKANNNFKERYANLTNSCGLFKSGSVDFLRQPPCSQIWRDHLLSIATRQDYDEGFFVFLFPAKNSHCQKGADDYRQYLVFDNHEQNCFHPRHLEDFINTLTSISNADWILELKNRYLGEND
jgi:hypothetical protein